MRSLSRKGDVMDEIRVLSCADCGTAACRSNATEKFPKFCLTEEAGPEAAAESLRRYGANAEEEALVRNASILEAEFYCKMCRVEETIEFARRMGYKKIGIATCMGLLKEAGIFSRILKAKGIDHVAVCCKVGAIDKSEIGMGPDQKLNHGCGHESMCNPILQAETLHRHGTDFNVVMGLCVGHDSLFMRHSHAPVTVMVVKDRVLGHNPAAALYMAEGSYSRFKTP